MTWNYRIIKSEDGYLALHEVFYDEDGNPSSCTEKPVSFIADPDEGIEGITISLERALSDAKSKPILDMDVFGSSPRAELKISTPYDREGV